MSVQFSSWESNKVLEWLIWPGSEVWHETEAEAECRRTLGHVISVNQKCVWLAWKCAQLNQQNKNISIILKEKLVEYSDCVSAAAPPAVGHVVASRHWDHWFLADEAKRLASNICGSTKCVVLLNRVRHLWWNQISAASVHKSRRFAATSWNRPINRRVIIRGFLSLLSSHDVYRFSAHVTLPSCMYYVIHPNPSPPPTPHCAPPTKGLWTAWRSGTWLWPCSCGAKDEKSGVARLHAANSSSMETAQSGLCAVKDLCLRWKKCWGSESEQPCETF